MKKKEAWEYAPKSKADVAHQWASRKKESASYSSLSFQNGTIYSYHWWPMAKWYDGVDGTPFVISTARTYSRSTGRHQAHVRHAIPRDTKVFYTNTLWGSGWSYRSIPDLSIEAAEKYLLLILINLQTGLFEKKTYRYGQTPEGYKKISEDYYNEAKELFRLSGNQWNQDFDKYVINDHDVRSAWNIARPVIEREQEKIRLREEKERKIKEALDRAVAKYCKDSFEMACEWMKTGNNTVRFRYDYVDIPEDDEYFKLTGINSIYQRADTAMRIQENEVVTNMGARVPLDDAKKLWELIKRGHNVRGVQCGLYTVVSMNGELVIGCHHISRRVIDFFVEYYNW